MVCITEKHIRFDKAVSYWKNLIQVHIEDYTFHLLGLNNTLII